MIEISFRFNNERKTAEIIWLHEKTPSNPTKKLIIPKVKNHNGEDYIIDSVNFSFL